MLFPVDRWTPSEITTFLIREHPGVWSEAHGFENPPHIREWYDLEVGEDRLAVAAPRESAKSEVFSVVSTLHYAERWPGSWQLIYRSNFDLGKEMLDRIMAGAATMAPQLVGEVFRDDSRDKVLANYSRIQVAGTGAKRRGLHPDRIVGDDVLDDDNTATERQRRKVESWWFGTVSGMPHGWLPRTLGWGYLRRNPPTVWVPPTRIRLVGTPFHEQDLLMGMRHKRLWRFVRYEAEFETVLPGSLAVEDTGRKVEEWETGIQAR